MTGPDDALLDLTPADLDGHTLQQLSDYLDDGQSPPDPTIDGSVACQLALAAMLRLRATSLDLLERDARSSPLTDTWVAHVLEGIHREAHAGRSIPIPHPDELADLSITEGAVRGAIRAAADRTGALLVGRCSLEGDLEQPDATVTVVVEAAAFEGQVIPAAAQRLRAAIAIELERATELRVAAIDIRVTELLPRRGEAT